MFAGVEFGVGAAPDDHLRTAAQRVVAGGAVGVQVRSVRHGLVRTASAGVSDLATQREVCTEGRFRIGRATQSIVATVVLQLVAEGRLHLDAPLRRHLPGLVPADGEITVRMLLQHTSGLHDHLRSVRLGGADFAGHRYRHYDERELVALSTAEPLDFAPGTGWCHSATNYTVLGLVVERVTSRPWRAEVAHRVFRPLGMRCSSAPGDSVRIPGRHAQGYLPVHGSPVDVTELRPSWAGAAGELISTTADLDRFLVALAQGRLLPRDLLAEMTTALPHSAGHGLGLVRRTTPCGVVLWGHRGGLPGFATAAFTSLDGTRRVVASATTGHGPSAADLYGLVDAAVGG
ncbi:serine hydrolase domain-containing protein [Actinosynnema sp. NPDC050436]|uniref:serine hydrolase domain-containing protein n=1 Tax=Actinosynnema sp. NPDC050436 TaxID=3155659 RepID=UPI0033E79C51